MGGLDKGRLVDQETRHLFGTCIFGDCFGTLGHGVLGQLAREDETDGRLDLPTGDGRSLVVMSKSGGLPSDSLEDIIHKAVHYAHSFRGDASIRMNLLKHFVDVDGIALASLLPSAPLASWLRWLSGLLRALCTWLGWHDELRFYRLRRAICVY